MEFHFKGTLSTPHIYDMTDVDTCTYYTTTAKNCIIIMIPWTISTYMCTKYHQNVVTGYQLSA